jgi:hypothetical protein
MRISIALVLGALAFATTAHADDDKKYSMADLKSLVGEKHYQEALMHMGDIKPSARNADWKELLGSAAAGYVESSKDDLDRLRVMLTIEEQYPSVVKYAKYATVRASAGPKGFDACFANPYGTDECRSHAIKFVDADAKNGKLVLAVAKVARRGMNPYNSAPLFKRAMAADKKACKDSDLSYSTVAAMALPSDHPDFKDGKVVVEGCFPELKAVLLKGFKDGGSYYKQNVCPIFDAKKEKYPADACAKGKDD